MISRGSLILLFELRAIDLTLRGINLIYTAIVFKKVIAALFVATWLLLLGIEFSQDVGVFDYDDPGLDHSMEATLASLGKAIKMSDDTQTTALHFSASQTDTLQSYLYYVGPIQDIPSPGFRQGKNFLEKDTPIFKLHRVFLI